VTRIFRLPRGLRALNLFLKSWTAAVFAFLYVPIILLIVYSFNTSRLNVQWEGFTFDWYRSVWDDEVLIDSLKNSLIIAGFTTAISVIIGTLGAWMLHRYRFPWRRALNTLVFVPMVIPEIIMGISLLILFTMITNWLEVWQAAPGAPGWFSDLEFGRGLITVIISHVTFCFPFVLVAVQARLAGVDPALEEAAMDLGATPARAFWHVMVPYMLPAIISGALMTFTLSMDEIIVTFFTSGPDSQTLPLRVFGRVKKGLDPSLNAISAIFIVATAAFVIIAEWLKRRRR
jgi:spermidine/putrescine transport system permease protein